MRKMSSGMSQRKVPGGHSANDRKVTSQASAPEWDEQGGSRDRGERLEQPGDPWKLVTVRNAAQGGRSHPCPHQGLCSTWQQSLPTAAGERL